MGRNSKTRQKHAALNEASSLVKKAATANGILLNAFGGNTMPFRGMGADNESLLTSMLNTRHYLITNQGQLLSDIYTTNGILTKFINMPVEDALSSGFRIKTDMLSETELKQLENKMLMEGDIMNLMEAFFWKRLDGGGGLITVTNSDYSKPFDEKKLKKGDPLYFKPFSKWQLHKDGTTDLHTGNFEWDNFDGDQFTYFQKKLHRSRMFILKGVVCPHNKRVQTGGWGLSELEGVIASLNNFIKANQLIFEILGEYKVDILQLEGLHAMMMNAPESVHARAEEMARIKDMKSMLVLDAKDTFTARNLTFAGIPEILSKVENHLAAIFKIPATRFWGISASGFSSGSEDLEAYNVSLNSSVRTPAMPILLRMTQLRCIQLYGFIPDDLEIEYFPFRDATAADTELKKNGEHARIMDAFREGLITDKQYNEAVNRGGLLPIKLGGNNAT